MRDAAGRNAAKKAALEAHSSRISIVDLDVTSDASVANGFAPILADGPWMGAPWSLKQHMDEVYTAGMDGRLCNGDGRTAQAPR